MTTFNPTSDFVIDALIKNLERYSFADLDRDWAVQIWNHKFEQARKELDNVDLCWLDKDEKIELDVQGAVTGPHFITGFDRVDRVKLFDVALANARKAFEAEHGPIAGNAGLSVRFIVAFERRVRHLAFITYKREDWATD